MPIASQTAARDAIYGCLKAAVAASSYSSVPIYYDDVVKSTPPATAAYIQAKCDLLREVQSSLGEAGNRRFRIYGIIMVQVFTPFGDGLTLADVLSGVVKGAFRGVNTGSDAITFRNTRVVDVGPSGAWRQTNVVAEFDYDEIA